MSALTPAGVLVGAVLSKKSVNSFFSAFFYLPSLVICESLHPDHLIKSLPTTTSPRKKKEKEKILCSQFKRVSQGDGRKSHSQISRDRDWVAGLDLPEFLFLVVLDRESPR